VGKMLRREVYTLNDAALLAVQEAMVRKIVAELREFDNVYYEVCNEPYFGGVTGEWQDRIIATLVASEAGSAGRHLIAQNIANGGARISGPNREVSIFNFHYARPAEAVSQNYPLNRAIADDETGFKGTGDAAYRTEGWDFMLAGGAVYDNLDYSFTVGHEGGTAPVVAPTPGGGGPSLRRQLQVLKEFISGFDFIRMRPDDAVIQGGVPAGAAARALAEPGKAYAIYLKGGRQARLELSLPEGRYQAQWVNPSTGANEKSESLDHAGGRLTLASPEYTEDMALRVVRR